MAKNGYITYRNSAKPRGFRMLYGYFLTFEFAYNSTFSESPQGGDIGEIYSIFRSAQLSSHW